MEVFKGIDFYFKEGVFVFIMGFFGFGKFMFFNILGILDEYDEGEYCFDGKFI